MIRWVKPRTLGSSLCSYEADVLTNGSAAISSLLKYLECGLVLHHQVADSRHPTLLFSLFFVTGSNFRGFLIFELRTMVSVDSCRPLPKANSQDICLRHPTDRECLKIWELSSLAWKDALTLPQYLEESALLTTVPLARDGGMTIWILVDKTLPPDQRPILCACESFRKRSLISSPKGELVETVVHGVASVFCDPAYRGRGYAARLMRELAKALRSWQAETICIGSVLYSDIGKTYYANFGWHPFPNNSHIEFSPSLTPKSTRATPLLTEDLDQLCREDEAMIRKTLAQPSSHGKLRMVLVPDLDHMLWHHGKEEFACGKLFGKKPQNKGAVAGQAGSRVWAIWTHRYYQHPESSAAGTVLYILRLVVENQMATGSNLSNDTEIPHDEGERQTQVDHLRAVIQAAQAEAVEWKLSSVNLWDPTSLVQDMIEQTGLPYRRINRDAEGIASLLWYGDGSGKEDMLEWVANEKFAWC